MKRYAELIRNYKNQMIKNFQDNKLVIDSDYRGPVIAAIHNDSTVIRTINPGDRIGQLILMPKFNWTIEEVEELSNTERGQGGFGHTGK